MVTHACNPSIQKVDASYPGLQHKFKANLIFMNYRRKKTKEETETGHGGSEEEGERERGE